MVCLIISSIEDWVQMGICFEKKISTGPQSPLTPNLSYWFVHWLNCSVFNSHVYFQV
jgi:hypothetical protein